MKSVERGHNYCSNKTGAVFAPPCIYSEQSQKRPLYVDQTPSIHHSRCVSWE